jgi:hypothetical protein
MRRTPGVLLLLILAASPLAGQPPPLRTIPGPLPNVLPLSEPTEAEQSAIMLAILEQGLPYLVSYAGTDRLRLFPIPVPLDPAARDSLRQLAKDNARIRLCGPGLSRCDGPYPYVRITRMEALTPGQVLVRIRWSPGPGERAWKQLVDPLWRWDRETELGVYPMSLARGHGISSWGNLRPTWDYGYHNLLLVGWGEIGFIASRGTTGWMITPAASLRARTPNGRLELDGRPGP